MKNRSAQGRQSCFFNDEAVRFVNVKKIFVKEKSHKNLVLRGLSFVAKKKRITAILGPSGSGKTTAARIINGLEDYDEGKIFIGSDLLTKKNQRKIRKKTAFVFQNFNLFPHMSILENIIYSPINVLRQDKNMVLMKAKKMLKQFNLEQKMNCLPHELSGGQKQRAAIIRALILEPEILIMDEPTASLDPEITDDVVKAVFSIKRTGVTIIIITHDIIFAKKVADDVVMFYGGKCVDSMDAKMFFDKFSKKHFYSQRFLKRIE